jgi:succinate-semialdehyde dehydrogenase/glutarate-semialdehyde dehydrogenase
LALVESLLQAGLPEGVVNLVFGDPAAVSAYLIARPEVRKISFTGSVPVGKLLARQAAAGLKRCTFELGGHAPAIVFADAEVEAAAKTLAAFKFRNAGQVCIAPSRFYVDETVYSRFREAFIEEARGVVLGSGLDERTSMGPMANRRRVDVMNELKSDAIKRGARVVFETRSVPKAGFFVPPMVLEGVSEEAALMVREPFGPIAPLVPFANETVAIEAANRLPYGLSAYLFTRSPERARDAAAALESGSVAINTVSPAQPGTPFGGVKESGYGYEGGREGIDAFLVKKLLSAPPGFVH